ncbi:MAG: hypothetical protein Q8S71_07275 [Hydrogenophaga sp.]|nr:hypothetical protein [Hydrogenophaga sp.]
MKNLLIASRGVRALARGSTNICAQRMLGAHQIARHAQRAGR